MSSKPGSRSLAVLKGLTISNVEAKRPDSVADEIASDKEIEKVMKAIAAAARAAEEANERHQEIVQQIKRAEIREEGVHKDLIALKSQVVNLTGKLTVNKKQKEQALYDLDVCKRNLAKSQEKLKKIVELEKLVEKQKREISDAKKAANESLTKEERRKEITKKLIKKLKEDIEELEARKKREFDEKVDELDKQLKDKDDSIEDLKAKVLATEISLKKEQQTSSEEKRMSEKWKNKYEKRTTELKQCNTGRQNSENKHKSEVATLKEEKDSYQSKYGAAVASLTSVKKSKKKATKRADKAEESLAKVEGDLTKLKNDMDLQRTDYESAKKAMKEMKQKMKDTPPCIPPVPRNQPVLAGQAEEPKEIKAQWIKGPGEGLYHPHDYKEINGVWTDVTPREKLEVFARFEGRFNGIRRTVKKLLRNGKQNIAAENENDSLQKAQNIASAGGRDNGYITGEDKLYIKFVRITTSFMNDMDLKKIYEDETEKASAEKREGAVKIKNPSVEGLLPYKVSLKF